MSFKENFLEKIRLDKMRIRVLSSIGPSASGIKPDKASMKILLKAAGFCSVRLRNIEMYIPEEADKKRQNLIFVLDNELAVFNTTINDLALRKEPTLKEMISIKNAIKILNDQDVIVSKREKSVETIYKDGVSRLDLGFTASDIKQLEYDGRAAVEWKDSTPLLEVLSIFSELLDYQPEPKVLSLPGFYIRGVKSYKEDESFFGPFFLYNFDDHSIQQIKEKINTRDKGCGEFFREVAAGKREPAFSGPSVIKYLAEQVLQKHNPV